MFALVVLAMEKSEALDIDTQSSKYNFDDMPLLRCMCSPRNLEWIRDKFRSIFSKLQSE